MIGVIIILLVLGIVMGFLARAVLPGEQKMGLISTILIGAVGSYLGAGVAFQFLKMDMSYIYNAEQGVNIAALVAALVGSLVVLIIWCLITKRNWR